MNGVIYIYHSTISSDIHIRILLPKSSSLLWVAATDPRKGGPITSDIGVILPKAKSSPATMHHPASRDKAVPRRHPSDAVSGRNATRISP
ncbi:hypothetical protein PILCRDRAFT_829406 [Piloderma croceum F 1598]|uniref:Uncharacterized protein n=1 Tax=Piloderma croceum (strain F 1598) TaxID=765440 RepID=A0A0C3EKJ4_PILCF|nr:hypothetical protein PILCRDRAFT_829406 [Piloderma croceum F 1598]